MDDETRELTPPPELQTFAAAAKALGDPRRMLVLRVLLEVPEPLCGCEVSDVLGLADYQTSRFISTLRRAGLVEERARTGTWVHYGTVADPDPATAVLLDLVATLPLDPEHHRRLELRFGLRDRFGCVLGAGHPEVVAAFEADGARHLPQL